MRNLDPLIVQVAVQLPDSPGRDEHGAGLVSAVSVVQGLITAHRDEERGDKQRVMHERNEAQHQDASERLREKTD
jgi:hypothetical protein